MGRLIRTVLVLAIVLIVGAYFLGYLPQTASVFGSASGSAPAPATVKPPDVEASKDAPAKPQPSGDLQDRAKQAAQQMDATLADAALTTKIKAKIALDDTVKHASVSVHTKAGVVTIAGTVNSPAMQQRILQLARETAGVKTVVNETTVAKS
jgi:hyperosmotically inducible periplasmic protein